MYGYMNISRKRQKLQRQVWGHNPKQNHQQNRQAQRNSVAEKMIHNFSKIIIHFHHPSNHRYQNLRQTIHNQSPLRIQLFPNQISFPRQFQFRAPN